MKYSIPGELKFLAGAVLAALGFVYVSTGGQIFKEGGKNPASLNSQGEKFSNSGLLAGNASSGAIGDGAKPYSETEMAQDFSRDPRALNSENWAKTVFDREKMTVTQYGQDASGNEYVLEMPVDQSVISKARGNIASGKVGFSVEGVKPDSSGDLASFERTVDQIEMELKDVKKRSGK